MDIEIKKNLLNSSLERTAEKLGDITPNVMERFYARFQDARQCFEELYRGDRQKLEGEMIEQVLYCLMEWYDCPGEIEIVMVTTIPHHVECLHVHPEFFSGLIDAVCDTVVSTIPAEETGELGVWAELQETMRSLVDDNVRYICNDKSYAQTS